MQMKSMSALYTRMGRARFLQRRRRSIGSVTD